LHPTVTPQLPVNPAARASHQGPLRPAGSDETNLAAHETLFLTVRKITETERPYKPHQRRTRVSKRPQRMSRKSGYRFSEQDMRQ
jgi:hypothetical protein